MRKLYRNSTVHPSPPPASLDSDPLAFLPAAIFTLTAALSTEDKEVLAYLLSCSCSSNTTNIINHTSKKDRKGCAFSDHSVTFRCSCFRCYMSYWIRWDASPNRQLIHEIIDSFEDSLLETTKETADKSSKKSKRKKGKKRLTELARNQLTEFDSAQIRVVVDDDDDVSTSVNVDDGDVGLSGDGLEFDKGSMRKFVSFVGDRIWGVLGGKE